MKKKITDADIRRTLQAARGGKALGLDARPSDFDSKNMPRARLGSGLSQIRVSLGLTLDDVGEIDLFAWDTFRNFVTGVRSGIKAPAEIEYLRAVNYAASNPLHLKKMLVRASSAAVLADTEIAIVRRTPFGSSESERLALASLILPSSQQTDVVEVPLETELDGASFLRVYVASYGVAGVDPDPDVLDDQSLSFTCFFDAVAERRAAL